MARKKPVATRTEARAVRSAQGVVRGESVTAIARREGVCRETIHRDLSSRPALRILTEGLIEQESDFRAGFREALTQVRRVMNEAMLAERIPNDDGKAQWSVSKVADNRARMDAVGRFKDLLALGLNHAPQHVEESGTFIWSEFMTAYEEREQQRQQVES